MRSSEHLWNDCQKMFKYKHSETMMRTTGRCAWKTHHHCHEHHRSVVYTATRILTFAICFANCDAVTIHITAVTLGTWWCNQWFLPQAFTLTFVGKVDWYGGAFPKMLMFELNLYWSKSYWWSLDHRPVPMMQRRKWKNIWGGSPLRRKCSYVWVIPKHNIPSLLKI